MPGVAILSQGVGYAVVLGIGLFFSALMVGLTWLQNRYSPYKTSSASEFTSASHSVRPGLISAGIVSAWTWAATLLQSSAMAYKVGISGSYWYAAGATVQILLFAQNAAKLKINAPHCRTFLEVISCRFGRVGHMTFGFFSLATNVIVCGMLLAGASATVTDLTGMNTYAVCCLLPLSVAIYVTVGGMRSSLLADYIHTAFLYCIILAFMFVVYAGSPDKIGSPGAMYDMLQEAAARKPIDGNAQGSYVTMRSRSGIIFGVINIIGNFATVYNDQAYWQRAIASRPGTSVKAFMLGGSAWFAIPFGLALTLGLAAVVLTTNPSFPGYPNALTAAEVSAGLPAPAAAAALLGKGGAAMMLVLLFLAVTSATSAELVAVSSLLTYDVYVPYINPVASEERILFVNHISIAIWAVFMAVWGIILHVAGISMGWLYEFMGTVLGSAVAPIAMSIMWKDANKNGCIAGAWIGLAAGIIAWLVTAAKLYDGELTIETTGEDYPMLAGNLAALVISGLICTITSLMWPANFDFSITRALHAVDHIPTPPEALSPSADDHDVKEKELGSPPMTEQVKSASTSMNELEATEASELDPDTNPAVLRRAFLQAVVASLVLFVVLVLLVPLPLFGTNYIFSKAGFTAYVAIAIAWVFYGTGAVVLYPIWESRSDLKRFGSAIYHDIAGKRVK